ncbi:MAG: hypothetical protein M5U12_13190 [Verrucomicrobia bacterium]|nr:hypothetical protein [Verrucomicrobiota bacterium]
MREPRTFASHYYAAYHRLEGPAGTKAFPKDIEEAARFLARLQGLESRPVADWGRRFGRFMREKHAADPHAKPNLSFALVLHGDGFLRVLQGEDATRTKDALERARAAHEATFSPRWQAYLRAAEADLQERHPALYDAFRQDRERVRRAMNGGSSWPAPRAWPSSTAKGSGSPPWPGSSATIPNAQSWTSGSGIGSATRTDLKPKPGRQRMDQPARCHDENDRDHQSEGRGGQDDHRRQPGRRPGPGRSRHPPD